VFYTDFIVKMEAAGSSEIMVTYHNTRQQNNPEDTDMNIHSLDNLKTPNMLFHQGFSQNKPY